MSILDDVMGEYGFAVPKAAYDKLQEYIAAPPEQAVDLTDGQIIELANAAFSDQPRKSEGRKDNDLFYLRTVRAALALIDSKAVGK